jgi:hypothetical protein
MEVLAPQALSNAGGMYHIVEMVATELLSELLLGAEVKLDEVYARVLEVSLGTGAANGGPRLEASLQSLSHDEAAYETACASNEYFHFALIVVGLQRYDKSDEVQKHLILFIF